MPNQITRDIYVTKNVLKNPIHYVRGTDLIPIVMRFKMVPSKIGITEP